ncbi:MAG: PAS domain S-box protein [Chitinophagaceae bacterium]|nr:PAS domain S-box protein [Chitinophagaceae bacterium]
MGKPFLQILPEMKDQPFPAYMLDVYKNGVTHYGNEEPAYFITKNGEKITTYFNFVYQPYHEEDGTISGVMIMASDVTEQVTAIKKMEESENKFRVISELMPEKIWTSDEKGNKIYFNKTMLDYLGATAEELTGGGWKKRIHPEDWISNESTWQQSVTTGENYEAENRLLRKDGVYLWHLTRAIALRDYDGNIKGWVGSKTEIQEQKNQQQHLENAVINRTAQLLEVNKELEQKNQELISAREKLLTEYSRSLIEASLDPLVTINIKGKVTDMNQATVDITGVAREKLTGSNFFDYFTDPKKAAEVYKDVFAKGSAVTPAYPAACRR